MTAVLLAVLNSLVAALQPLPLKLLVDNALGGHRVHDTIASTMRWAGAEPTPLTLVLAVTGASFVLAIAAAALGAGLGWLWEYIGKRMIRDLKTDLFDRLQRRSLADHCRLEMGDTLSRLSTDSWSIYSTTHALLSAPFERLLTVGAISVAAWTLSPTLALVTLGVTLPFAVITYRLATRLRSATRHDRAAEAGVVTVLNQLLTATPIVQAFAAESRSRNPLRQRMEAAVCTGRRAALTNVAAATAGALLTSTSTAIVLIVGGMLVLGGQTTLGTLLVFLAYLQVLDRETQRLLRTHRTVMEGVVGLDRVLELWGQETVIADPPDPEDFPPANPAGARVELIDVTVGYLP
ncbi:MAG: ABC transporter transmembrane domain-containing protein, partial [Actinomycetota bacterium]|nr:ABC transporter transmembrane domain-containing protein [Actinomycetota bacterium]